MMSLAGRWMRGVRQIAWTCRSLQQGRLVDCSASSSTPMMEGPGADSEEKHEPVSDIDTDVVVVGLKGLDPEWPIREAIGAKRTSSRHHLSVKNDPSETSAARLRCNAAGS